MLALLTFMLAFHIVRLQAATVNKKMLAREIERPDGANHRASFENQTRLLALIFGKSIVS